MTTRSGSFLEREVIASARVPLSGLVCDDDALVEEDVDVLALGSLGDLLGGRGRRLRGRRRRGSGGLVGLRLGGGHARAFGRLGTRGGQRQGAGEVLELEVESLRQALGTIASFVVRARLGAEDALV